MVRLSLEDGSVWAENTRRFKENEISMTHIPESG